jgi:hypothetical protein
MTSKLTVCAMYKLTTAGVPSEPNGIHGHLSTTFEDNSMIIQDEDYVLLG